MTSLLSRVLLAALVVVGCSDEPEDVCSDQTEETCKSDSTCIYDSVEKQCLQLCADERGTCPEASHCEANSEILPCLPAEDCLDPPVQADVCRLTTTD